MRRVPLALAVALAALARGPSARAGDPARPAPAPLTVERLFGDALVGGGPPIASWRPGRDAWVEWRGSGADRALWEVDAETGAATLLLRMSAAAAARADGPRVPLAGIVRAGPPDLVWARGGDAVVVPVEGDLVLADLVAGTQRRLTRTTAPIADVRPSPDGTAVAFSREHDLHVAVVEGEAVTERRRTTDGSEDVLNATLDWVYPEELDVSTAIQWSPDGKRLAFLRLEEAGVPRVAIGDPIPLHGATTSQRYPKAGDRNPVARVLVVGRDGGPPVPLDLGDARDAYVPWFTFTPDGRRVLVAVEPRDQASVELRLCDPAGGPPTTWWRDADPRWVDVPPPPTFLRDGSALLRSRRGGWWRLWRVPLDGAASARALTPDGADASAPLAVDEDAGVAFVSSERRDVLRTVVLRVPLRGGDPAPVSDAEASHEARFSTTGRYYVDQASTIGRPPRWTLRRADGGAVRELADAATPAWTALALPAPRIVRLAGDPELVASIRVPRAFDAGRRWPVVFHVYGGPGSRMVRDAFGGLFEAVLAETGCVVVSVDGRGTSGRGKDFEAVVHRRLGACEVEDLVAAVDRLAVEPWFDRSRVGVWGWSYGGTLAALAAVRAPRTFSAAVAVAPVTDWRLYDSIYTERYMDLPSENEAGYRDAAACTWARDLGGALLLAHGLADDNVHVQNTMRLVQALVAAGKPYDLRLYPQRGHGIEGADARLHVHRAVLEHFRAHLVERPPAPAPAPDGRTTDR